MTLETDVIEHDQLRTFLAGLDRDGWRSRPKSVSLKTVLHSLEFHLIEVSKYDLKGVPTLFRLSRKEDEVKSEDGVR